MPGSDQLSFLLTNYSEVDVLMRKHDDEELVEQHMAGWSHAWLLLCRIECQYGFASAVVIMFV